MSNLATDIRIDIIETINKFARHTDHRDWEALSGILAEEVYVDYTSLTGGEPGTMKSGDLIAVWQGMFASLTVSQHLISNHLVEADGTEAACDTQCQARFTAAAPHGDRAFLVGGDYRFGLERAGTGWRVNSITMISTWSSGNPGVLGIGQATGGNALELARRYLDGLMARDGDAVASLFTDDGILDMPYSPPGFPKRVQGTDALRQLYGSITRSFRSIRLPIAQVQNFADPSWVLVEFDGDFEKPDGGHYSNHYFGTFHVVGGKIKTCREVYDPLVFTTQISAEERASSFQASGTASEA